MSDSSIVSVQVRSDFHMEIRPQDMAIQPKKRHRKLWTLGAFFPHVLWPLGQKGYGSKWLSKSKSDGFQSKKSDFLFGLQLREISKKKGNLEKVNQNLIHEDLQLPTGLESVFFAMPSQEQQSELRAAEASRRLGALDLRTWDILGRRVRALKQWGIIPKFSWFMMEVSIVIIVMVVPQGPQELDIAGWFMMVYWSLFHGSSYFFMGDLGVPLF